MSFTFVVEDGTGLATATSYISVSDADDYITANTHASTECGIELEISLVGRVFRIIARLFMTIFSMTIALLNALFKLERVAR